MIVLDTNVMSELMRPKPSAVEALLSEDFEHRIASFDETAAAHYADIVVHRERLGRPIGTADAQIAATCRSHGALLATRNVDDFTDTAVEIINPWAAA